MGYCNKFLKIFLGTVFKSREIFKNKAGQERFRSITKQYFRKADGVICMYDVTSEQSFKSLRNWIYSIKVFISSEYFFNMKIYENSLSLRKMHLLIVCLQ
jgi:GTPase SAR1 family protein